MRTQEEIAERVERLLSEFENGTRILGFDGFAAYIVNALDLEHARPYLRKDVEWTEELYRERVLEFCPEVDMWRIGGSGEIAALQNLVQFDVDFCTRMATFDLGFKGAAYFERIEARMWLLADDADKLLTANVAALMTARKERGK